VVKYCASQNTDKVCKAGGGAVLSRTGSPIVPYGQTLKLGVTYDMKIISRKVEHT